MLSNLKRNWWPIVVIAQIVLGLVAVGITAVGLAAEAVPNHPAVRIATITIGVIAAVLLIAGLLLLRRNRQAGSWLILFGSIPTLLTVLALNPVALLAVATIAGGLWTGNLAFTARSADANLAYADGHGTPSSGRTWYRWLVAAIVLFGIGLAAVMAFDGSGNETVDGVKWIVWIGSWTAAAASAAIGVALGLAALVARHRTRPAESVTTT